MRARAGPHKILGLFSNLKSNLALPPWPGPAAVMNELSGRRRHAPPATASLSHGLQPPEPPPASRTGTGEGTHPIDARSFPAPCPGGPEDPREGAGLVLKAAWAGAGREYRWVQVVGGQVQAAWECRHCRDAGRGGRARAGARRWCEGEGKVGWARAGLCSQLLCRPAGTTDKPLAPSMASWHLCCHPYPLTPWPPPPWHHQ